MDKLKALYGGAEGRIARRQWWIGVVGLIVASIVLSILLAVIGLGTASAWGQLITYVILFYPSWCIGIKRRQDRGSNANDFKAFMGLSALVTVLQAAGIGVTMTDLGNGVVMPMPDMWLSALLFLLGLYGIYMLVQLGFLRGTPGSNTYGPDPLAMTTTA